LPLPVALILFVAAWQLMIAAMMLPSTLPLLQHFRRAASAHPNPGRAEAALIAGYFTVWTVFGAAALLGDGMLHRAVDANPWLAERPWLVAGTLLVVAGAAQFMPLTQACLQTCRHPVGYLMQKYRPGTRAAYELGVHHGMFCLGCCWALMLVMFAAGVAGLVWMAALAAVMVYEKVGRHGSLLAVVAGLALLMWGTLVLAHPGWLPQPLAGMS